MSRKNQPPADLNLVELVSGSTLAPSASTGTTRTSSYVDSMASTIRPSGSVAPVASPTATTVSSRTMTAGDGAGGVSSTVSFTSDQFPPHPHTRQHRYNSLPKQPNHHHQRVVKTQAVYDNARRHTHHRVLLDNCDQNPDNNAVEFKRTESKTSVEARYLLQAAGEIGGAVEHAATSGIEDVLDANGMISNELLEDVLHEVVEAENEDDEDDENGEGGGSGKPRVAWYMQIMKLLGSTFGLVFAVFVYSLLGAFMFQLLEQHEELRLCEGLFILI
jgi:hypothetical protein